MVEMFTAGRIGGVELKNRLVRSATWEALGDAEGRVTDALIEYTLRRVRGGVGLHILGITSVAPEGRGMPGMVGIYSDDQLESHRRLTGAVHEAGGRISVQLAHVGAQTTPNLIGGREPVGPSAVFHPAFKVTPRALTTAEVKGLVEAFGQAAARAVKAGYDLIQLHGAHGYLIDQFLSPRFNRRDDDYAEPGHFALEVYKAVRANAGRVPVHIKLNLDDLLEDSVTPAVALPVAKALSELGLDAIEVSAGGPAAGAKGPARVKFKVPEEEGYFLELAKLTKAQVKCPVISVGGWRSPAGINRALAAGEVDFVSLARPFIREPGLVSRWQSGDLTPAQCISCNRCFGTVNFGEGIQCWVLYQQRHGKNA